MSRALLLGPEPAQALGYSYVKEPPYEAVVIGGLSLGQLLQFREEAVLSALAAGLPVLLYSPGLPESPGNRALASALAEAKRQLQGWGIRFVSGKGRTLITAQEAKRLHCLGQKPEPGAVLTPLAREILEGTV